MDVPDLADPRPPYLQISDDLRRRIGRGDPPIGKRIETNRALAERYGTSSETVRRALRVLTDEGLIQAHSTLGTFVMRQDGDAVPSGDDDVADLRRRVDELECLVMDTRAAVGLDPVQQDDEAAAR